MKRSVQVIRNARIRPLYIIEAEIIRMAIAYCNGNLSEAADQLGISRSSINRKVDELHLHDVVKEARAVEVA